MYNAPFYQNSEIFPPEEYQLLRGSINVMVELLNASCREGQDPPDRHLSVTYLDHTGRQGRPRLEIDPQFLPFALEVCGPTSVARALGCHPRTVRRRALDYNILPAGVAPLSYIN